MSNSHVPPASLPPEARDVLENCKSVIFADNVTELVDLSVSSADERGYHMVSYEVPGRGVVDEVEVCRIRNGIAGNYLEPYMRRRDPDCMVIADDRPTNKTRFHERFNMPFDPVRKETFEWLKTQDLACFFFKAGGMRHGGMHAMAIAPANAGFFALGLAMLQGIEPLETIDESFAPRAVLYIAPPFRHTHFEGRQVVAHNRFEDGRHELFSYNLYPGPSAKKGVYGMLLNLGEREDWITAHCSTCRVTTPYDNSTVFMHEGASGGGKSEMNEQMHREDDGRLRLGTNVVTGDSRYLALPAGCKLEPVTDDMALCHPSYQQDGTMKLRLMDAEDAWFLRVNHIRHYGTDPHLERVTLDHNTPKLFLNIHAKPGATALIWEHVEDSPGVPCPNPRVVVSRANIPDIVNEPVTVDIRSFGVRCPPCTQEKPTYGILGLFHMLPPALAWLWRLTAPRGHANPSIVDTEGMTSEGVGSYWPFATGRRVDQANLILDQIRRTTDTIFLLIPNQHIGSWHVGFAPQWITREYFARRGAQPFDADKLVPSRCSLLGATVHGIQVEGQQIGRRMFQVEKQPEVGEAAYDEGARILQDFFDVQVKKFLEDDLDPLGKEIIQCCLDRGTLDDYAGLIRRG